jgi:hypothetical protein
MAMVMMVTIMNKPAHFAVDTAPKQRVVGRPFVKGQSGNPLGRPKSARSRHSENFLASFSRDFEEHGEQVIAQVRQEQPATYLKIAADLLPKQAELDISVDIFARAQGQLEAYRVLRDASKESRKELADLRAANGHGEEVAG